MQGLQSQLAQQRLHAVVFHYLKLSKTLIGIVLALFPTLVHPRSGTIRAVRTDVAWLMADHAQTFTNVPSPLLITHLTRVLPRTVTRVAISSPARGLLALACRLLGRLLSKPPFLFQPGLNGRPLKGAERDQISQRCPPLARGRHTCKLPKVNLQARFVLLNLDLLISDLT